LDFVDIKVCLSDTASLYINKDGVIELVTSKHRSHIGFISSLELDHFDLVINDALEKRRDELYKRAHEEIITWALISSGVTI